MNDATLAAMLEEYAARIAAGLAACDEAEEATGTYLVTQHIREALEGEHMSWGITGRDIRALKLGGIDPVGIPEIAARLAVKRGTVDQWRWRGLLPQPKWTVGGSPAWDWPDVEQWANETGRLVERS